MDVKSQKIYDGRLTVADGMIRKITPLRSPLPADAPYLMPGFVDGHVHIESSMVTPAAYAEMVVRHGTIAAICDAHEIANVLGVPGVDYMIQSGRQADFHFLFGAPSCVPCTPFETAGASLGAAAVDSMVRRGDIGFLSEMMNFVGVVNDDPEVMAKLRSTLAQDKPIDGHAPGLTGDALRKYVNAGISTDHECSTLAEAEEKVALGMQIIIREGSAARNFEVLSPLVKTHPGQTMFCTDDMHPDELAEGHINTLARRALAQGAPLWNVLQTACVNPRNHYRLQSGLLQTGDPADFIVVSNLQDFPVKATYIHGRKVFDAQDLSCSPLKSPIAAVGHQPNHFQARPISPHQLRVSPMGKKMKVMVAYNGQLLTGKELVMPKTATTDGEENVVSDVENDVLKIVVYNRYTPATPQIAFIKGFGLKEAAMASSCAHDSHNIIAIGTTDELIAQAVNRIIDMNGGQIVVTPDRTTEIALPITGLLSPLSMSEIAPQYTLLTKAAQEAGCKFDAPFMTLSFMALPVIPELKLSDKGLFDVGKFQFTRLME